MGDKRIKLNIYSKLVVYSLGLIVLSLGLFGGFGIFSFSQFVEKQTLADMEHSREGKVFLLDQAIEDVKREAQIISMEHNSQRLLYAFYRRDESDATSQLRRQVGMYLKDIFTKSNGLYENIFFADQSGTIVVDGTDGTAIGVNLTGMDFYEEVKQTGTVAFGDVMQSPVTQRPVVVVAVPVYANEVQVGTFSTSIDFNKLTELVVKRKKGVNFSFGLFNSKGVCIAHENKDAIFKLELQKTEGLEKVFAYMQRGESGNVFYTIDGVDKVMSFQPVGEEGWYLFAAHSVSEFMHPVHQIITIMLIIVAVCLVVGALTAFFYSRSFARPVQKLSGVVGDVARGDLSVKFKEFRSEDEIGQLSRDFKGMVANLREVIKNVVNESTYSKESAAKAQVAFKDLKDAVESISAAVEEISAGMEESASSTEEVSASSEQISTFIDEMAVMAQSGATNAKAMQNRAKELKANALGSKATAERLLQTTQDQLEKAVNEAKVVAEIETMTTSILAISSQTNLLALNAAIEAARAGEAGRGFAVVADEIRSLAEGSAKMASQIQKITKQVTSSVTNLVESSNQLLNFINNEVRKDYDVLVETGQQYDQDAEMIAVAMREFTETSEKLAHMIGQVSKAIGEIAGAVGEGAEGTNTISSNIATIADKANEVALLAKDSGDSAERLNMLVKKFKI